MGTLFDSDAPKKATNLSINSDLLSKARAMNINLSATLEQAQKDTLVSAGSGESAHENPNAIRVYNEFVEEYGCFGEEYRKF